MKKYKVLFVCLGNICRSPLAEVVFRHLVYVEGLEDKFEVDSCGTGHWHAGEPAHRGSVQIARENGISLKGHHARQLTRGDFDTFDLLVALDRANLSDMKRVCPQAKDKLCCLREHDPEGSAQGKDLDVPDPYYEGGFDGVFDIIHRSCSELLSKLKALT